MKFPAAKAKGRGEREAENDGFDFSNGLTGPNNNNTLASLDTFDIGQEVALHFIYGNWKHRTIIKQVSHKIKQGYAEVDAEPNAGDNRPAVGKGIMKGWNAGPVDGPVRRIPP